MAVLQKPNGLNKSCFLLIVIAGMERFAFKGVASNLVTYLTDVFKMSNSAAAKTVNNWCGFTSMLPLLVASVADSCWGRNSTILVSSFVYVMGLVALTSTALARAWHPNNDSIISSSFLFSSLCLISLGQGGYNPSLQAFGADQLGDEDELPCSKEDGPRTNRKSLFFQWWYFGICGGSLLGVTLMAYIQDTIGWVWGFAIPTIAMVTSIILFCSGSRIYTYKPDEAIEKKPFKSMVHAIKETASKFINCSLCLSRGKTEIAEIELEEKPLCPENLGSIKVIDEDYKTSGIYMPENVRVVLRLVPIWTQLLLFAVIFQQPATFFTKQGMTMKRNIGSDFKIPPATLQSVITLSIILLMPLYDKVMIPIMRLITGEEMGITVTQRMGIGMVLSIIAMVIAALVETERHRMSKNMEVLNSQALTVPLSIFWLLPQYILLGISDIFTVVGMQEFFYSEVPTNMKTMGIALYTSVFGVGSFLSAFLISATEIITSSRGGENWFSDDMRETRLDKYYWLLVILSCISLLFYVILCRCYKSRSDSCSTNCK